MSFNNGCRVKLLQLLKYFLYPAMLLLILLMLIQHTMRHVTTDDSPV